MTTWTEIRVIWPQAQGQPPDAERGEKHISFLEHPEGSQSCPISDVWPPGL